MRMIMHLSKRPSSRLYFRARSPNEGWRMRPINNGKMICTKNLKTILPNWSSSLPDKNRPIQRGVTTIPISPEILALKIAVGTFPLASDTMTTEEETVEGRAPRKNRANHTSEVLPPSNKGIAASASNGKTIKVQVWMTMCAL